MSQLLKPKKMNKKTSVIKYILPGLIGEKGFHRLQGGVPPLGLGPQPGHELLQQIDGPRAVEHRLRRLTVRRSSLLATVAVVLALHAHPLVSPPCAAADAHSRETGSIKASTRKTWPKLPHRVHGRHQLIVDNHNATDLWIALRDGSDGADLKVPANGKGYLDLPEGKYRVYVFRTDQPTSLYEASTMIKLGGPGIISSSCRYCLCFDEAETADGIDPATGLPIARAR